MDEWFLCTWKVVIEYNFSFFFSHFFFSFLLFFSLFSIFFFFQVFSSFFSPCWARHLDMLDQVPKLLLTLFMTTHFLSLLARLSNILCSTTISEVLRFTKVLRFVKPGFTLYIPCTKIDSFLYSFDSSRLISYNHSCFAFIVPCWLVFHALWLYTVLDFSRRKYLHSGFPSLLLKKFRQKRTTKIIFRLTPWRHLLRTTHKSSPTLTILLKRTKKTPRVLMAKSLIWAIGKRSRNGAMFERAIVCHHPTIDEPRACQELVYAL